MPALSTEALAGLAKLTNRFSIRDEATKTALPFFTFMYLYAKGDRRLLDLPADNTLPGVVNLFNTMYPIAYPHQWLDKEVPSGIFEIWSVKRICQLTGVHPSPIFWTLVKINEGFYEPLQERKEMMTEHEQVQEKIAQLRANLLQDTPQLPTILQQVKIFLSKNEEIVTILSDEEINAIISAAQVVSREKVVDSALSKKGKKALKDTELDDLM